MPLACPLVYGVNPEENSIEGGSGEDLAEQVIIALRDKLSFSPTDMYLVRGKSNSCHVLVIIVYDITHFWTVE